MTKTLPTFFLANDALMKEKFYENIHKVAGIKDYYGIKINLDLIIKDGKLPKDFIIQYNNPMAGNNFAVFVDMKMWNGKRTMQEVVEFLGDQGVNMINVYALADNLLEKAVKSAEKYGMAILGVTTLTHYTEEYCQKVFRRSMAETVRFLAEMALNQGCDGYILPGTMLYAVADLSGIKFNPAVRPAWFEDKKTNFQEQIFEPGEAIRKGADIVSCGSPVFKSPDPEKALGMILSEVRHAYKKYKEK